MGQINTDSSATKQKAKHILKTVFGYDDFRSSQDKIIEHVSLGGDALVLMPTGGGKSLCYQIPALLRTGVAIVVSPLIALMQDQVSALEELGVRAAFLNSTQSFDEILHIEKAMRAGELDLVYIAPERLLTQRCLEVLSITHLALFAIDEAHCVSQWGHDFRPEYIKLSVLHERFPHVPRIALTATADEQTRKEIIHHLQLENALQFVSSFDRPNIRYQIIEKSNSRQQLLDFIRAQHQGDAGIVYCLSRRKVEEIAAFLNEHGMTALPYHAGLSFEERSDNQARFLREDGIIMTATIAFGMGIDKPDVRFVAHLDLPKSIEAYYQETGRAGRDGASANAWMSYGLQDLVQQRRMVEQSEGNELFKRVQNEKLDALLSLCETLECRRVQLLRYFGQDAQACGNCDTCLHPPQKFDGTIAAQKMLSTIYRVNKNEYRFASGHIIDVLMGNETDKVLQWRHHQLSTFGIGADKSEKEWKALLRQIIALDLISVDYDNFNALTLTEKARDVLLGKTKIELRRYQKAEKALKHKRQSAKDWVEQQLNELQQNMFNKLRNWRLETARKHNTPAYIIFHDNTLREIARTQPQDLETLKNLNGVGARKLESYGQEILELVKLQD